MAEHFIGVERLSEILTLARKNEDPLEILTELECGNARENQEKEKRKKRR
jgi:hypothetical protein